MTSQPTTGETIAAPGTWTPAPGAAPLRRMIAAQAAQETRQLLRNGEQLTLTLVIPLLLLAAFSLEPLIDFGGGYTRIDFLTPGVIALAVMSTAFTSQAIATGFERRYGVLKRLGATPLSRQGLIAAKTVTVIAVELLQTAIILLWVIGNIVPGFPHPDKYPFLFLTLGLSLQASYAAPLILLAQNRQDDRDRVNLEADREEARESKADLDYLAREIAAIRMALGEVATRDFLRSELARAEQARERDREGDEAAEA